MSPQNVPGEKSFLWFCRHSESGYLDHQVHRSRDHLHTLRAIKRGWGRLSSLPKGCHYDCRWRLRGCVQPMCITARALGPHGALPGVTQVCEDPDTGQEKTCQEAYVGEWSKGGGEKKKGRWRERKTQSTCLPTATGRVLAGAGL